MPWQEKGVRRSVALRADEEFAITVAARNRRGNDAADMPAARPDEGCDIVAHGSVYSRSASKDVERVMRKRKRGSLKSGSGRKIKSRKQAIAIGLSEARRKGKKVPRKSTGRKGAARKTTARKSGGRKRS
jgi:hypothetical protein